MTAAHDGMRARLAGAIDGLDARAENDKRPRWVVRPTPGADFWCFSDSQVLFRFGAEVGEPDVDLDRWVTIAADTRGDLGGYERVGVREVRTGQEWRRYTVPSLPVSGDGVDILWIYPPAVALNARLLRIAMAPAAPLEPIMIDAAPAAPVWFHGLGWSTAIAHLRTPLPTVRSERVITLGIGEGL